MDDLTTFFCWNKNCLKYGIRGDGNIRIRSRYGDDNTRLLWCLVCKKTFTENRGTVFFDSRLPKEQVVSILEHVAEGNGMRKTGRLTKTGHMTVSRYTKLAGEHAEKLHDELVEFSPLHRGSSVRREVEFRRKEGKKLRHKKSR
jgi:transposase-like protein